jgi:hypothetical protein
LPIALGHLGIRILTDDGSTRVVYPAFTDGWRARFASQLLIVARRDRWDRVFYIIAPIHFATFAVCHAIQDRSRETDPRLLWLWVAELAAVWLTFRAVTKCSGYAARAAAGVVFRIWVTFFILVFNSILMNAQSGWSIHWYRLAWPTLSTFGFAVLAWLIDLRFLYPAVWMWLTGLAMVRAPDWSYLIYGASWAAALIGIAAAIGRAGVAEGSPRPVVSDVDEVAV